jgi:hypothetical protein
MRGQEFLIAQLPILLWQYGLITIHQLEKIFDWQEQSIGIRYAAEEKTS